MQVSIKKSATSNKNASQGNGEVLFDMATRYSTVTAFFAKGSVIGGLLLSINLVKSGLEVDEFAIWLVAASLMQILQFSDFGLGNGVVSILSTVRSSHNGESLKVQTEEVTSTAFFLLLIAGLSISIVTLFVSLGFGWQQVFNTSYEDSIGVNAAFGIFFLMIAATIPLSLVQKLLWSSHQMYVTNVMQIGVVLLQLSLLYLCSMLDLTVSYYIISVPLSNFLVMALVFTKELNKENGVVKISLRNIDLVIAKRLWTSGSAWFSTQVVLFIAVGLDLVYANKNFTSEEAVEFGLMLRLMQGLTLSLFFTMPLWPRFSEAIMLGHRELALNLFNRTVLISTSLGVLGALALFFLTDMILKVWVGLELVEGGALVATFAFWSLIYNIWCAAAAFVGNEYFMACYVKACVLGGGIAVVLKFPLAAFIGVAGLTLSSAIGITISCIYVLCVVRGELHKIK
jgi:O-antigen/teichoic acid export membrane protein